MKLDFKKTIKVGFAFAIICLFWGAYDFVIPLLLERAFGLSNAFRGLIMGLDNLLSLFLLPLFGRISDKTKTKYGRRTPYIFIGTILSVALMIFVPISANKQLKEANVLSSEISAEVKESTWYYIYKNYADKEYLERNDISYQEFIDIASTGIIEFETEGKRDNKTYTLDGENITEEQAEQYELQNANYNKYCKSGLNSYISEQIRTEITDQNTVRLIIYMIILFFVLITMATFRSPAVALMPDVTPKPLRSQANAVINLMGGVGSALAFIIYTAGFFISDTPYIGIFACVGAGMLLLMVAFLFLVNENKFVKECEQICDEYGISNDDEAVANDTIKDENEKQNIVANAEKLKKAKMTSFLLILASIFMWFMGYNAVSSNLSVYCTKTLNLAPSVASIIAGVSMAISALAFIPVGYMAVKFGRKKSILFGFTLAVISYVLLWLIVRPSNAAQYLFAAFYLIAGFGLIIANVNTFPMVVELSKAEDVGKYTGFYYTATMSAQAVTPFFAGLIMDAIGDVYLFAYSAVCVIVAIVLMSFVKHGDSRPPKKTKLEMLGED